MSSNEPTSINDEQTLNEIGDKLDHLMKGIGFDEPYFFIDHHNGLAGFVNTWSYESLKTNLKEAMTSVQEQQSE